MRLHFLIAALAAGAAAPSLAQDITPERPEVINRITACRSITASAERLACFDREVAALEAAASPGDRSYDGLCLDRPSLVRSRPA